MALIGCAFITAKAQEPIYDIINTDSGLPSNQVYAIHQDSLGNLWFCTDNGIARYDGINMKTYGLEDGLPDNVIFSVQEDPKGRLWFLTYKHGLFYMENDSIIVPPFNNSLIQKIKNIPTDYFYIDTSDSIFIVNRDQKTGFYKVYLNDTIVTKIPVNIPIGYKSGDLIFVPSNKINNSDYIAISHRKLNILNSRYSFKEFESITSTNSFKSCFNLIKLARTSKMYVSHGKTKWLSLANILYKVDEKGIQLIREFPSPILSIYEHGNELLIGTRTGFYRFNYNNFSINPFQFKDKFFKNMSISSIIVDRDGVYWMATLNSGVIRMAKPNNNEYIIPETIHVKNAGRPFLFSNDTIHISRGSLFNADTLDISSGSQSLLEKYNFFQKRNISYNFKELKNKSLARDSTLSHIYTLYKNPKGLKIINDRALESLMGYRNTWHNGYLYCHFLKVSYRNENKPIKEELLKPIISLVKNRQDRDIYGSKVLFTQDNHGIYCTNKGFLEFSEDSLIFNSSDKGINTAITTVLKLGNSHYLYGTYYGLYEYKNGESHLYNDSLLKYRIEDLKRDSKGLIYAGTKGGGLVVIAPDTIFALTQLNGLSNNNVEGIQIVHDTAWVGTSNGLNSIYIDYNLKVHSDYHWVNSFSGHNPVINLAVNKDEVVFEKEGKLLFIKRHDHRKIERPKVILEQLFSSGKPLKKQEKQNVYSHTGKDNSFEFHYRINSLLGNPFVYYEYRLLNYNDQWIKTKERKVQYYNLPFGKYEFQVRAINSRNMVSENTAGVSLEIKRPLILIWWFQLLIGILVIGLIFFIIQLYLNRKKRKLNREKAMISSNLFALKMQINPHFIFNALNSIQYFIASNQERPANEFLSKFSTLIRNVLSYADQTKVALQEELKSLENYMELENMRLKNGLCWSLDVDPSIDAKRTFIPSMILQPLIENAIWHGISNVPKNGTLSIKISRENHNLKCIITDNGPGMKIDTLKSKLDHQAEEKRLHKSVGLSNVIRRLELLSKMEGKEYQIHFDNLNKEPQAIFKGTVVSLTFPINQ